MSITREHLDEAWIRSVARHSSSAASGPFKFVPFPANRALAKPPGEDDWRPHYLYLDNSNGDRRGWIVFADTVEETYRWNTWATVMMAAGGVASLATIPIELWIFVTLSIVLIIAVPALLYYFIFMRPWLAKISNSHSFVLLDEDVWNFFNSAATLRASKASLAASASLTSAAVAGSVAGAFGGALVGKIAELAASKSIDAVTDRHVSDATSEAVCRLGEGLRLDSLGENTKESRENGDA